MKKNFSKIILGLLVLVLVVGCRSSSSNDDDFSTTSNKYYYTAKLDGVETNFLHTAILQGGGNGGRMEHIVLAGYIKSFPTTGNANDTPPAFVFEIWNMGGNITAGIYDGVKGGSYDDDSPDTYSLDAEYLPSVTTQFDAADTKNFVLNITELSKENGIKATFSGTLTSRDFPGKTITVTDGKLYLPFNKLVP
ncbi:hypothetical protein [Soonwooa sp.]|uniref:hypothetical protein n=1 Tax=Soonwooa sp. TaxID=1938592 RepID=UPI002614133D|nr:hypothetical protein [Soonwooa sp.]